MLIIHPVSEGISYVMSYSYPSAGPFFCGGPGLLIVKKKDWLPKCVLEVSRNIGGNSMSHLIGCRFEGRVISDIMNISQILNGKVPGSVRSPCSIQEGM